MTRLLPILFILPIAAATADTIKLKTGEVLQGHVLSSDATSVTIEVQFSPTIVDQQTYARADIAELAVESGDEVAYAKISGTKTPETALGPKACQSLIDEKLAPFLKQYPSSSRAADVRLRLKAIQADLARLQAGDVKVFGIWYDKASFEAEKYQIEAATLLEAMKQQIAESNYPSALNHYDLLQRSYASSLAYVEAVSLALKGVTSLQQELNFNIGNLPQTKALRQASIDRTPVEQQQPIKLAIASEDARAAAAALAAQKNNQRFFAVFAFDEKGLLAMQTAAQQTETQLKAIDLKKLEQGAHLVRQANEELATHQLAGAATTLDQLKVAWPEYEGLGRMQQRLQLSTTEDQSSSDKEKAKLNSQ